MYKLRFNIYRFDSGVCYVTSEQVHFKLNVHYTQDYITHKYTWQDQIYELGFPCIIESQSTGNV